MIITCNKCNKKFEIDENLIPYEGRLLQCGSCNHRWFFKPNEAPKIKKEEIPEEKIPTSESLKNTFERVVPYYKENIEPLIRSKKNILISAHGNSLRALCKNIFLISTKNIINFEIPTGNPLLIRFENDLKVKEYKYLDTKRAKKILFKV